MSKLVYVAALTPEDDGGYSVLFPSAPGAITEGDTLEQAVSNAQDALETILETAFADDQAATQDDSERIAALTKTIVGGGDIPAVIMVERPTKAARVNVTIEESLLTKIDRAAAASGRTRSGFLADAARAALQLAKS